MVGAAPLRARLSAQRPKAIEAGRTLAGEIRSHGGEACSTPEGDRSGADARVATRYRPHHGAQRPKAIEAGRTPDRRPRPRPPVLNARRRSKRGGLNGGFHTIAVTLCSTPEGDRSGADWPPRAALDSGGPGAQRPKAIEAGRTSTGQPDVSGLTLCSTPEGDRSGADAMKVRVSKCLPRCSTPEGDRSGADFFSGALSACKGAPHLRLCSTPEGDRSGADCVSFLAICNSL